MTTKQPETVGTWRYRVSIDSTMKEGYRVKDVTVEFIELTPGSTGAPEEEIHRRLIEVIVDGETAARMMNQDREDAKKFGQYPGKARQQ